MPVTVGPTSPLPGTSRAKDRAHKKASIAARLSAALFGAAALAAGDEPAAACVAVRQQPPGKRRPAHSVLSSCSSEDVHVPFDFYPLRHPCLSKQYEAAEEARALKRHLWAERHAAAVDHATSEHRPVLLTQGGPLSAAHTMAVAAAALENCTAGSDPSSNPNPNPNPNPSY